MFSFNSAEPSESPERTLEALDELIPDISELAGYLVVVEAYVSEDETAVNLAQKRADYVSALLIEELGVPAAQVRAYSADGADGGESWRQRADVYFSYVGYK
jgi:outer membrane protein OmpA-like peptidoglycan-associated protein